MKDYYDLYLLTKINKDINFGKINTGLSKTMTQRDNLIGSDDYKGIINYLKESEKQKELWSRYESIFPYAKGIDYKQIIDQIHLFSDQLIAQKKRENSLKRTQRHNDLEK